MSEVGTMVLMPDTVFVSAAELAEIIGADLETVNNWIRRGIINRTPIGQRPLRNRLFSKEEVYKTALKNELVKLGIPPSPASDAVNTLWKDWDRKEPAGKHKLYAVVLPNNGKLTVPCARKRNLEDRYTNTNLVLRGGRKSMGEMDLPQQAFAVIPISAVLDSANSRLSELLLGTTRGRFSRG